MLRNFAVVLLLLVGGCVGPSPSQEVDQAASASAAARTVVAILDSGVNVYHDVFRSQAGWDADQSPLAAAPRIEISSAADYDSARDEDAEVWNSIQPRVPYIINETRLAVISFGHDSASPPVLDEVNARGHGSATSGLVALTAADALILVVQVPLEVCGVEERCVVNPAVTEAMEWIAEQPWIDVVSMSIGIPSNAPTPAPLQPDELRFLHASQKAAQSGKLIVAAAGNTITPAQLSYFGGPPWVITVGGFEADQNGEAYLAARLPDVVANYTTMAPASRSRDAFELRGGTSFGAPVVAGVLAQARAELVARGQAEPSSDALRAALNATAEFRTWDDYNATPTLSGDPGQRITQIGLPILEPSLQMGWGYVTAATTTHIVEALSSDTSGLPPEKAQVALTQGAMQAAREEYWRLRLEPK